MLRRAERELKELLVSTYDNIGRVEDSMLASHKTDLTIAELHGLEVVGRSPDGQASITSIAQTLGLTLPTVTVAIKRLEKKGYVEKHKDTHDARVTLVTLTRQGRKMDAAHRYFHENMVRSITGEMSENEVETLVKVLGKLNAFFERKQQEYNAKK